MRNLQDESNKLHAAFSRLVARMVAHIGSDRTIKALRACADILERHAATHGHTAGRLPTLDATTCPIHGCELDANERVCLLCHFDIPAIGGRE